MTFATALVPFEAEPFYSSWMQTAVEGQYPVVRPLFFSLPKTPLGLDWNRFIFASFFPTKYATRDSLVVEHGIIEVCEKVRSLQQLQSNWAGERTIGPSEVVVRNAASALMMIPDLCVAPDVVPNSNGTISFLWEEAIGTAHLEIGESEFSFYADAVGIEASEYGTLDSYPGAISGPIQAIAGPPPFSEPSFTISAIEHK